MSFDDDAEPADAPAAGQAQKKKTKPPAHVKDCTVDALELLKNRISGVAPRVPTPFKSVDAAFGGGLLPMLLILVGGTGFGKTTLALQFAHAALMAAVPVMYVGLELSRAEVIFRMWGLLQKTFGWSEFHHGKPKSSTHTTTDLVNEATTQNVVLDQLPLHIEEAPPGFFTAHHFFAKAEEMRRMYPLKRDAQGKPIRGSSPLVMIIDFLQLFGAVDDAGRRLDDRERVSQAAYIGREIARRFDAVVMLVSSSARGQYGVLGGDCAEAGLGPNGVIESPEALMGAAKESGDTEYAADALAVAVRFPRMPNGKTPVALTLPKMRAGQPTWVPLTFDGHRFEEATLATVEATILKAIRDKQAARTNGKQKTGRTRSAAGAAGASASSATASPATGGSTPSPSSASVSSLSPSPGTSDQTTADDVVDLDF